MPAREAKPSYWEVLEDWVQLSETFTRA